MNIHGLANIGANGLGTFSTGIPAHDFKPDLYGLKLDLAFNNVKPKDWYFVLD